MCVRCGLGWLPRRAALGACAAAAGFGEGGRGTLPFKAPELFAYPPTISPAADVYAFAVLGWVLVSGEQPYAHLGRGVRAHG